MAVTFVFKTNPYFENKELTKTIQYVCLIWVIVVVFFLIFIYCILCFALGRIYVLLGGGVHKYGEIPVLRALTLQHW